MSGFLLPTLSTICKADYYSPHSLGNAVLFLQDPHPSDLVLHDALWIGIALSLLQWLALPASIRYSYQPYLQGTDRLILRGGTSPA